MARIDFTSHLRRHIDCPAAEVPGATVREVLERYFQSHPGARSYVLDEQGALRKHVTIFVDGAMLRDRDGLADALGPTASLYVMQALSGG